MRKFSILNCKNITLVFPFYEFGCVFSERRRFKVKFLNKNLFAKKFNIKVSRQKHEASYFLNTFLKVSSFFCSICKFCFGLFIIVLKVINFTLVALDEKESNMLYDFLFFKTFTIYKKNMF